MVMVRIDDDRDAVCLDGAIPAGQLTDNFDGIAVEAENTDIERVVVIEDPNGGRFGRLRTFFRVELLKRRDWGCA